MTTRLDNAPDMELVSAIADLEDQIRELKVGVQYAEAKMFEYSSANASDLSGSLPARSGAYAVVASFEVTATSPDGKPFISSFVPQLWINGSSSPFYDNLTSNYSVTSNQAVNSSSTSTTYWFTLSARNAVSAGSFQFKARVYSTAPVTVSFVRTA